MLISQNWPSGLRDDVISRADHSTRKSGKRKERHKLANKNKNSLCLVFVLRVTHDQLLRVNQLRLQNVFCFTNGRDVTSDVQRIAANENLPRRPTGFSRCKQNRAWNHENVIRISFVITAATFFFMCKFFSISISAHLWKIFLDPAWLPSTKCEGNVSRISLKLSPWFSDLWGCIKAQTKLALQTLLHCFASESQFHIPWSWLP